MLAQQVSNAAYRVGDLLAERRAYLEDVVHPEVAVWVEIDIEKIFSDDLTLEEVQDVVVTSQAALAGKGKWATTDQNRMVHEGDQRAQAETEDRVVV